jgi:probable H4MPT-linked C1 transfer pathway protein
MKVLSLGLDIGGANTKAILLEDGRVADHWLRYIPLWKDKRALDQFLKQLARSASPDRVGATMTGELCDIFRTKQRGVEEIVEAICGAFGDDICYFMSLDGVLLTRLQSLNSPGKLAAANWVASALAVGKKYPNCLLIDVGSTTTDIIPVKNGRPSPSGWTDFQRLGTGELVYTGVLRTPLPCICSEVKLRGERIAVAAENFAVMADVYRALGMLTVADYTCETPDGRGKDRESCMQRIARTFCSDLEELGRDFVLEAARIFQHEQVELVTRALRKVVSSHKLPRTMDAVLTGLGRKVLAQEAAERAGLKRTIDLAAIYGEEAALMTPAFGVGMLAMEATEVGRGS